MSTLPVQARPDSVRAHAYLKRYAHFDEPPAPITTPPSQSPVTTPPETNGGNGHEEEKPIMNSAQLKERLDRERKANYEKFLKDFGIEDADADKERLKKAREQEEANRTEVEKAAKRAESAEASASDWKAKYEAEVSKNRLDTRDNAVKAALREAQVKNADKTFAVLSTLKAADLEACLTAEGVVDVKKVAALVDAARKDYAEDFGLKSSVPGTGSHSGGHVNPEAGARDRSRATHARLIRG